MPEQRQNDWETLEENALRQLTQPDLLIEDKTLDLLLRLWQYPSFERHKVWAVYVQRSAKEEKFLVQKVIWNRHRDSKRFSDARIGLEKEFHPTPSISTKLRNLNSDDIKPFIEELQKIKIPPCVDGNGSPIDGITFGFEFKKLTTNASFSWWCSAPKEWQPLETWFLKTKNFLSVQFAHVL